MNIDWSKAPEGATHYCAEQNFNGEDYGEHWVKPGYYFTKYNGEWRVDPDRVPESLLTARPSAKWTGQGLPPVGTVCELSKLDGCDTWIKAEILFITKSCVVFKTAIEEKCLYTYELKFRPIRTPEQIAAEERHDAILAMQNVILTDVEFPNGQDAFDYAAALYDAGYRKQEQPK